MKLPRIKLMLVFLSIVAVGTSLAQAQVEEQAHKWVDSYESYRLHLRALKQGKTQACERRLFAILKATDDNGTCTVNAECTLIGEEPFGRTVPVRAVIAISLSADMARFIDTCYDQSASVVYNSQLKHTPACVKGRCMVKTSLNR